MWMMRPNYKERPQTVSNPQDQMFTDGDAICRIKYNDNGSLSVDWFGAMLESQFVGKDTKIKKTGN